MNTHAPSPRATFGRGFIGLALLGWGLSILLGVTPHEDGFVGGALAAFGLTLVATSRRMPRVERLPALAAASLGASALLLVVGYDALFDSPLDAPKSALILWGGSLVAVSPVLHRSFRWRGASVPVATPVAYSLPLLGVPLATWGAQALFKGLVGTTPTEAFVRWALLPPVQALVWTFGWHPTVSGQRLAYATTSGRLGVDVGAACSGLQAMALFCGVLALYLILQRPSGGQLAIWSSIGVAGVYVTNLVRLAVLIMIGHAWGGAALARAHAQAGWIFFVAWALLFCAWVRRADAPPKGGREPVASPLT